MSNQHRLPAKAFRPEPSEYEDGKNVLGGLAMDAFLRACLRMLKADPAGTLARLKPYWPEEKPRGRPRRTE